MIMEPGFEEYPDFSNGFGSDNPDLYSYYNDLGIAMDGHLLAPPDPEPSFSNSNPFSALTSDRESPLTAPVAALSPDDTEFSETVKYISQILMEEDMEEKPTMFYDPLGLQITEKLFYDVLGESDPSLAKRDPEAERRVETPDSVFGYGGNDNVTSPSTSSNSASSPQPSSESGDFKPASVQSSLPRAANNAGDGFPGVDELLALNIFGNSDSILQFRRGLEEANKFLPKSTQLVIDLDGGNSTCDDSDSVSQFRKGLEEASKFLPKPSQLVINFEDGNLSPDAKTEADEVPGGRASRSRKSHRDREDVESDDERSNKQSANYGDESEELSEMFDKVLLNVDHSCCNQQPGMDIMGKNEASKTTQLTELALVDSPKGAGKVRGKRKGQKKETVDLRTLLILCAQAVSSGDRRTSEELLKQIRQHSSATGDGSQRLAHFFANGLEARLAGTRMGTKLYYSTLLSKRSAADILKAYQLNLSSCPFKRMAIFFANKTILKAAKNATVLHIVDFGILYGFQWPILIQHLATRPCGTPVPKLRITGIEFPQKGFRPSERNEDTGRRLKKYCDRFGVPFEYNAIASENWETIRIEDIKIRSGEVLAVNCLIRFKNLLDETVEVNCPRNAVLNLIRQMNPAVFVQSIANGAYNAPFFVTRFREALFHFSALFDVLDTNIPRDNEERLMYEAEFYGREAMNVIACEGLDRVERPETYKQWQVRNMRAGFQSVPLDRELMGKFQEKLKAWYHKDFVMDEDSNWLLQGWKGRIVYASSCWVPV